jgi:tripartite-type tricarboxylate transporter receptor subunit TctC
VALLISDLYSVQARVKAGELGIIAVTSTKRAQSAPEVPTVAESALPGYEYSGWAGLLAPAGVPKAIVQRMNHEIVEIVNTPEIRRQMSAQAAELVPGSAEDFQKLVDSELKLWRGVAEKGNIRAE